MFDIIGDIHGHADELIDLLAQMGYQRRNGAFKHPDRKAIFVGDFIDRGLQIKQVLQTVRPMIESGSAMAVMGNHEFNAIAYHTSDPTDDARYLRIHSDKNSHQHQETLAQLSTDEIRDSIEWFGTLPMWLELDGLRIVHASWDAASLETIQEAFGQYGGVTSEFMASATAKGTALYDAVEIALKGKEIELPDGKTFNDKEGHTRSSLRIKWFESAAGKTFRDYALPAFDGIPDSPIPDDEHHQIVCGYGGAEPPVFFGHYRLNDDTPKRMAPNVACVDYSDAEGGSLCAYRWNGEKTISDESFVTISAR